MPDAHPETIFIGSPLDGTKNPKTVIGTKLKNITGIVNYQVGALLLERSSVCLFLSSLDIIIFSHLQHLLFSLTRIPKFLKLHFIPENTLVRLLLEITMLVSCVVLIVLQLN